MFHLSRRRPAPQGAAIADTSAAGPRLPSRRGVLATFAAVLLGAGLAVSGLQPAARALDGGLPVVASFSILADIAREIGGDRVAVTSLVGPGGDVHVFSPAPADAARLATAKLIITNGLNLEGWMPRLIKASGAKAPVVVASRGVDAAHVDESAPGHIHESGAAKQQHDHDHGRLDPHAWQDVRNAIIYARNIRDGLIEADPAGRPAYEANAARYIGQLEALDADIRRTLGAIPPERRRIITNHDAFGYFGRAYGMKLTAPQGLSTESEASATDVARVIRQIREEKAPAVFIENISDPRLMQRIARETKAHVGGKLFTDSLSSPDGPAPTYIAMMRSNLATLTRALAPEQR